MKLVSTIVTAVAAVVLTGAALLAQSGSDLFARALVEEKTGSYEEAIALYQTIVDKHWSDKRLAARALAQMGQAYEKLGKPDDARKAYERIARELATQKEAALVANERLTALSSPISEVPATRFVMSAPERDLLNRASVSPDGRWLALTDPDSRDVAVRDMSTGKTQRLMAKTGSRADPGTAEFLALSPDMSQVAYTWAESGGKYELRVMPNRVDGKPRVLVSNPEYDFWTAAWFPDGNSILGMVERPDRTWQLLRIRVTDGHVDVIKSLGWRIRAFTGSVRPNISPDGQYIAYAAVAGNPDKPFVGPATSNGQRVYIIAADGSGPEIEVVKTASANDAPVWTPDGRHILFISDVAGTFDVWSIGVRSGKPSGPAEPVVRGIGDVRPLGIASGTYYYRLLRAARPSQISIAEVPAGAPPEPIGVNDRFVGDSSPTWSSDGQLLAFYRHGHALAPQQGGRDWDLVVRSVTSGHERVYRNRSVEDQLTGAIFWLDRNNLLTLATTRAGAGAAITDADSWYHLDLRDGAFTRVARGFDLREGLLERRTV